MLQVAFLWILSHLCYPPLCQPYEEKKYTLLKITTKRYNIIYVYIYITVMIGSKGPNISSFIIRESSGTSSKRVGAIFLSMEMKGRLRTQL